VIAGEAAQAKSGQITGDRDGRPEERLEDVGKIHIFAN
jgi:hypothetical protein